MDRPKAVVSHWAWNHLQRKFPKINHFGSNFFHWRVCCCSLFVQIVTKTSLILTVLWEDLQETRPTSITHMCRISPCSGAALKHSFTRTDLSTRIPCAFRVMGFRVPWKFLENTFVSYQQYSAHTCLGLRCIILIMFSPLHLFEKTRHGFCAFRRDPACPEMSD